MRKAYSSTLISVMLSYFKVALNREFQVLKLNVEHIKMIFGDDTILGPDNNTLVVLGDARYDTTITYFYAAVVILAFIVSGVLNPALLWFHFCRPATIPIIVFRMLNTVDFLTTTCLIPYLAYGLLSPALVPHQVPASLGQRLYSALFAFILFISVSVTTLMTAVRVYAIKYPLKVMKKRYALLYPMTGFVAVALVIVGVNYYYNTTWDRFLFSTNRLKLVLFDPTTGKIDNWPELAFGCILMSIAMAGSVCAVVTGKEVYRFKCSDHEVKLNLKGGKRNCPQFTEKVHSCVTILMLAAGIQFAVFLVIIQFVYSIFVRDGFPYMAYYFFYGNGLVCSLVTSVLNPIIKLARSSDFKRVFLVEMKSQFVFANGARTYGIGMSVKAKSNSQTLSDHS